MARDFDGSASRIVFANPTLVDGLTDMTVSWWFNKDIDGESTTPRMFDKRQQVGVAGWSIYIGATTSVRVDRDYATTDMNKYSNTGAIAEDTLYHGLVTFDNTALNANIYINGTELTYATNTAGVGTLVDDSGNDLFIGDRGDVIRNFDGLLAEVGIWNRILTAGEIASLAAGFAPIFYRNGLRFYCPIIGNNSPENDLIGGIAGTVTGSTKVAHPRIIYPSMAQIRRFTTAVAAAAANVSWRSLLGVGR